MRITIISQHRLLEELLCQIEYFKRFTLQTYQNLGDYQAALLEQCRPDITIYDEITPSVPGTSDVTIGSSPNSMLIKPFRLNHLFHLLSTTLHNQVYNIQDVLFEPQKRTLRYGSKIIKLTEKETDLILYLVTSHPHKVEKISALTKIWNYSESAMTFTLETHLRRLKQKIQSQDFPELIAYKRQTLEILPYTVTKAHLI